MFGLIMTYLIGGVIAGMIIGVSIEPYSKEEWGVWSVGTFLWPLAAPLWLIMHLGPFLRAITPDRGKVTLSRKQQRQVLFMQAKNAEQAKANKLQAEYEAMISGSGYEVS